MPAMPRDCCAHHRPVVASPEAAVPAPDAPPDTPSCPMHAGPGTVPAAARHDAPSHHAGPRGTVSPGDAPDDCVMRGTCDGPPLFTFFSHTGVLPNAPRLEARASAAAATAPLALAVIGRAEPPDSRPPRILSHHS